MVDRRRPATLQEIADELGLHVSTVSRVLNGSKGARPASAATVERVRRLADELGYAPDPLGSGLRTRRSRIVGVLVPRLSDLVVATVYEGIEEAATERGLATMAVNTLDADDVRRARVRALMARRADGLIFGDARLDSAYLDELAADGTPFVLVNRRAPGHPSATCDDVLGGRLAAEHLLALGHTEVAVIAGEPFASTGADRTEGFVARYREAGIAIPPDRLIRSRFDTAGGRRAAEACLRRPDRPTAIFAVNDFAAIGALGAARDHGLTVGRDLALVGYNDTPLAAELPIALTSVASPMHAMGREALDLLVRLLSGQTVTSLLLPPELRPRASTDFRVGEPR